MANTETTTSRNSNGPIKYLIGKILAGVIFILPIVLTFAVIYQVYFYLNEWLIDPVTRILIPQGIENEYWRAIETYVNPVISLLAVLVFLYLMGYVFKTRLKNFVDWVFGKIPGVSTIYSALTDVTDALQGPNGLRNIDQVVLVPFPHSSARMAGYLMGKSKDAETGATLVCVYIPIALFPPSGYTLVLPEDQVILTSWEPKETWKLLLSGGLTVPKEIPFQLSLVSEYGMEKGSATKS